MCKGADRALRRVQIAEELPIGVRETYGRSLSQEEEERGGSTHKFVLDPPSGDRGVVVGRNPTLGVPRRPL
jgi:hypothetical protein